MKLTQPHMKEIQKHAFRGISLTIELPIFSRGGTMSSQSSGSSIAAGSKRPAPSPQPTSPAQTASLTASPADAEKPKRKSMSLQVVGNI